jgi:signal transduction histidine kinase
MELIDLSELVSSNIELLKFRAAEKRQSIDLEIRNQPLKAMADSDKFSRVVSNIVTNAIKFSSEDSRILVRLYLEDDNIIFSVKDSGIGIPASIKAKVFEMFTEAKRPGTNGEKPYGLGLSIAKQIVEAHKGQIWFDSEEGKGTTFIISLPVNEPEHGSFQHRRPVVISA